MVLLPASNAFVDRESDDGWNTEVVDVVVALFVVVVIVHGSNLIERGMRVWEATTLQKLKTRRCEGWHEKATHLGEEESRGWRFESRKTETWRRKKEVGTDSDRQRCGVPKME